MRILFGSLSLLVVLAIVAILAKKQLTVAPAPLPVIPGVAPLAGASAATPQQQVEQYQKALQDAMQQSRPAEDVK